MGGSILREESGPQRVAAPFLLGEDVGEKARRITAEFTEDAEKRRNQRRRSVIVPGSRSVVSEMGECE